MNTNYNKKDDKHVLKVQFVLIYANHNVLPHSSKVYQVILRSQWPAKVHYRISQVKVMGRSYKSLDLPNLSLFKFRYLKNVKYKYVGSYKKIRTPEFVE